MDRIETLFKNLEYLSNRRISSQSHLIDRDPKALEKIYDTVRKQGILSLLIPEELGGLGGDRRTFIRYNILLSQYSGALLFLQSQHQYAIERLNSFPPTEKTTAALKQVVATNRGLGFHLIKDKKKLKVHNIKGQGFRITGTLPWVTGYCFHDQVLVGFIYNERKYYALIPFREKKNPTQGEMTISPTHEMSVFQAVNTVEIKLRNWLIEEEDILHDEPLATNHRDNEHPSIYNLAGVSKAFLHQVTLSKKFQSDLFQENHAQLEERVQKYVEFIYRPIDTPLDTRASGLKLARECSHLAQLAWGGFGLKSDHPVQRLLRELWQYTIAGTNNAQIEVYLAGPSLPKFELRVVK